MRLQWAQKGRPSQVGQDAQTKSKNWGAGALSKHTAGQLRSDCSLLKSSTNIWHPNVNEPMSLLEDRHLSIRGGDGSVEPRSE